MPDSTRRRWLPFPSGRPHWRGGLALLMLLWGPLAVPGEESNPHFDVEAREDRLVVTRDARPVLEYVFRDEKILRPFFANVHAPNGKPVTRHHPPRDGRELTDHATMHPGLWLAFGDVSGADFWRNGAAVEHVEFVAPPETTENGVLTFRVRNRYVSGKKTVCTELAQHTVRATEHGYLVTFDSTFSGEQSFVFGDQEEMGLGVRVAGPLQVRGGMGRITNAEGGTNEKGVWGRVSTWCDYAGIVEAERVGLLLMPHPENFRRSWFHARDYGFVAANPFGRKAFTGGEASRVTVKPGESLRLRFGVLVYRLKADEEIDAKAALQSYVAVTSEPESPSAPAPESTGEPTSPELSTPAG